jgi:hypothetical protein
MYIIVGGLIHIIVYKDLNIIVYVSCTILVTCIAIIDTIILHIHTNDAYIHMHTILVVHIILYNTI